MRKFVIYAANQCDTFVVERAFFSKKWVLRKLAGKRELNVEETARLKQLWKKLVRMFHPDLHENDPEKRKTYELFTQAINEARDRGDIELLEEIAKDPQAFILKQGWAGVSLNAADGLKELRALYEHLQARILR